MLLIIIGFCISCKHRNGANVSKTNTVHDSILFYHNLSKDESVTLDKRHQALNKSFFFSKKTKKDTIHSQLLYQKNFLHLSLNEYDSLLIHNKQLISHALEIKDDFILARQYYLMGYYFAEVSRNNDKAFQNYTLSKTYFEKIKDSSWIGRNLLNMATIQKNNNDFFGSKETLTEALRYLNPQKDNKYIAYCYNALATNHRKLLNYPDATDYYMKAIETTGSKEDKLIYKNNLAATYIDNKEYNNSISLLQSIVKDSLLKNNQKEYARVLDNLAYAQWLNGNSIKAKAFLEPLRIRQQNNDQRGQIASYTRLGEFYSKTYPKKAESYFNSVIQLSKTIKMPRAEKDALKFLMQLQPQNIKLRDRYMLLQDSLYAQELKVKTQFAKYKYDDKLKQESILRLEKENAEKELEVAQQRNQKIIFSSIGGLLLMILGFAGYYFVQRTKRLKQENEKEKQKEVFKTEAKLSRRIHDDFGGKLNQAIILLQNNAPKSKILDVIGNAYDQSRDFSREINDVDKGPNFKNFLFSMLGNYSKNMTLVTTGSTTVDWYDISEFTKETVFKVLQELMINMQKHSKATLVSIDFEQTKKKLKIDYSDDGVGTSKDSLNYKNGLWNTEKRIQAINGTITFDSEEGKGFKALIEVPK
ncbi:MAG: ATP-binding protein [Saonia sp.]